MIFCKFSITPFADSGGGRTRGENEMSEEVVKNGDTVKVSYTGRFTDGEVFDTSDPKIAKENGIFNPYREYSPLVFIVGAGQVIRGFEKAVLGMKVGEKKTVEIPPEEAYGEVNPELVVTLPMEMFREANIEPKVGIILETSSGMCQVKEVREEEVVVDFNNPMAGKTLVFDIKVEEIVQS